MVFGLPGHAREMPDRHLPDPSAIRPCRTYHERNIGRKAVTATQMLRNAISSTSRTNSDEIHRVVLKSSWTIRTRSRQ